VQSCDDAVTRTVGTRQARSISKQKTPTAIFSRKRINYAISTALSISFASPVPSATATMTDSQPTLRKTRFVCVSDTHNAAPNSAFKLPTGDVLIHAGDLTNQGTYSELKKTIKWMEEADFEAKIIVAGKPRLSINKQGLTSKVIMILPSMPTSTRNTDHTSTTKILKTLPNVKKYWRRLNQSFG